MINIFMGADKDKAYYIKHAKPFKQTAGNVEFNFSRTRTNLYSRLLSFTNYDRHKCIFSTNYDRNKCFQNVTIANEELVNQSVQWSTEHQLKNSRMNIFCKIILVITKSIFDVLTQYWTRVLTHCEVNVAQTSFHA